MSTSPDGFASVVSDDFTVTSTHETAEQMTESLNPGTPSTEEIPEGDAPEEGSTLTEAARTLGKRAAEQRAAKTGKPEEKPADAPAEDKRKGNPRHDPTARVAQATREAKEAREEAARLREEAARERGERERLAREIEAARTAKPAEAPKDAPSANGKPKAEDFPTYEEFVEALADYKANERLQSFQKEGAKKFHDEKRREAISKVEQGFYERASKAAQADPSFVEKTAPLARAMRASWHLNPGEPVRTSHLIADEILSSEQAPAFLLHFSEHPEEFQRLTLLHPSQMVKEIGRLEERFERSSAAPPAPAPKIEPSKASPPVRPVAGSPATTAEPDPDAASFDEHLQFYNAKERRR